MSADAGQSLQPATAALSAGSWSDAKALFTAALDREPSPEAELGLGTALWWLGETEASIRHQERAYAAYRRRQDPLQAAYTAIGLCLQYRASLGNYAASRGWLGRLARLVDDFELTPMAGWVALCRAVTANDANEPSRAEPWARTAVDAARSARDVDLELCALAELGTALVQLGKLDDGTALLDEAMTGALAGEARRLETVVFAGCRTVVCCSRAGDVRRAMQWIRAADDFTRRYGGLHLYATCRVHLGGVLFATGRWEEAERELRAALQVGRHAERSVYGEALAALAELRLGQGNVAEAAGLLTGFEDHFAAAPVVAAVHLARSEPAVAAAVLRSRLDEYDEPCLESSRVVELLVECEVALGDLDEAAVHAHTLTTLGGDSACELVTARGWRAHGRVLTAGGDHEDASGPLRRALRAFARLEMPLETARARLLLAHALSAREADAAVAEAHTAFSVFDGLNAARDADAAAQFLRARGARPSRGGSRSAAVLTRRELEVLGLLAEGLTNRELAERLFLTRKTVEHHVRAVLTKLGLSNRAEAAAYAVRHLDRDTAAYVREAGEGTPQGRAS